MHFEWSTRLERHSIKMQSSPFTYKPLEIFDAEVMCRQTGIYAFYFAMLQKFQGWNIRAKVCEGGFSKELQAQVLFYCGQNWDKLGQ